MLLDLGVDIDAKDYDGWTPLHAASHWSQTEAVEVLCEALADMEAVNIVVRKPDTSLYYILKQLGSRIEKKKIQVFKSFLHIFFTYKI